MTNMSDDRFDLTPRQVVEYLDRYIVGQEKAKKLFGDKLVIE